MILSVADLLEAFRAKQTDELDQQPIKHGSMIGSMYEGLTRSMLDRAVFQGLDLQVVQGIITGPDGRQSKQIDCMLVEGEGKRLPYSESYIYPLEQVLAVVEVKKNLYASDLEAAYQNLLSVVGTFDFDTAVGGREFRDAWRQIMGDEPPKERELESLSLEEVFIFNSLLFESVLPLRIVWGYHGFATEFSLREAFLKYVGGNATTDPSEMKRGFGPVSFPSLLLCGPHALVKMSGLPYGAPLTRSGKWRIMGSVSGIPMRILLELIWTRLSYRYDLGSWMFGEDLVTEVFAPLVLGKPHDRGDMRAWMYDYIQFSPSTLLAGPKEGEWEPVTLTDDQYDMIGILIERDQPISVDSDSVFQSFVSERGLDPDEFVRGLLDTRILYLNRARELYFLVDELGLAVLADGRIVAGENNTGRFVRWVKQFQERFQGRKCR